MSFPRYPAYKDSGVAWLGEVPQHWHVKRLRRVAELNPSRTEVPVSDRDREVSFLPMEAVGEDGVLTVDRTRPLGELETGYTYFSEGDVIIAKITPCFENGKGAVVRGLLGGFGFGTTELVVVRPNLRETTSEYLHLIFSSAPFRKLGEGAMYGAGGQKRVPDEFVRGFSIAFPPLPEQHAISAFLDRETAKIDALIAEQEQLIELLQEKRQAVISHAVTKGLNPDVSMKPSGVEWLGDVPAHWTIGVLSRIARRVVVGIAEAATYAYSDTGVPILRSTNIRPGRIVGELLRVDPSYAEERHSKRMYTGDLVTVRTGNAGVTAVIPSALDGSQCFTMLVTTLMAGADSSYYCHWMNSLPAQCYFTLEGWGTAQVNISVPILKSLPVPIPPPGEQVAIVNYLDVELVKLDELINEAGRSITLLGERRASLISAAVTGQIDVRGLVEQEAA